MAWKIENAETGEICDISNVDTIPEWVHEQMGTDGTVSDFFIALGNYHQGDFPKAGRDVCGVFWDE